MAVLRRQTRTIIAVATAFTGLLEWSAAGQNRLTETEIKAGFLYNFVKFVELPPDALPSTGAPLELGIVGVNPFRNLLEDAAAGKVVNGRAVRIKQFEDDANLRSCQILYVSSVDKKRVAQVLQSVKGSGTLTVGEGDGFAQAGGMIAFVVEGGRVRLLINLEAVNHARIKISSQVIAVARLVGGRSQGRN